MNLGPHTKAAISRIANTLPYVHAEGTAVPTGSKDGVEQVRSIYAKKQPNGPRDPKMEAAEEWATDELQKGLNADESAAKTEDHTPEPEVAELPSSAPETLETGAE